MTTIPLIQQSFELGARIILFEIDFNPLNQSGIERYVNSSDGSGGMVSYGGKEYAPVPIQAEGFEWTSTRQLPRPRIKIGNVNNAFTAALNAVETQDFAGAIVTRIVTVEAFLDTGESPDGEAYLSKDVYIVDNKVSENLFFAELELISAMDYQNTRLPRRIMTKDFCTHVYRRWDSVNQVFDYSKASCPYAEDASFSEQGRGVATSDLDVASKKLRTCCVPRFGVGASYPIEAFPGMGRLPNR